MYIYIAMIAEGYTFIRLLNKHLLRLCARDPMVGMANRVTFCTCHRATVATPHMMPNCGPKHMVRYVRHNFGNVGRMAM